ncbi:MAG: cobalamin biosynthesis protein CobD [Deltaproteobacteria bacterium]|nr:cobalamin biosynthesis protein CobD [Deltaproteobacteria bacterium]
MALGDPRWLPHPVRGIGRFAASLEMPFRRSLKDPEAAGIAVFSAVLLSTFLAAFALIRCTRWLNPSAADGISILLLYFCLAARDLVGHGAHVYRALEKGDLAEARKKVARIVGRDTDRLEEPGVVRAAVESVAENIVDGITAPLFYAVLFGPLGAVTYRAVNTLDSLFGYRNERYIAFGRISARADDAANFLPARVTGLLVPVAAFFLGFKASDSLRIFLRDRHKHPSPNSGHTEAAVAGALGVQLGGLNYYDGRPSMKPLLGDSAVPPDPHHIRQANALALAVSGLAVAFFLGARFLIGAWWGQGGGVA